MAPRTAGETMYCKEDHIAVFDSGVGGISVLRQLYRLLPGEQFVYYGDSANAPYGARSTDEVRRLALSAAKKIMECHQIKALVVACNTATAAAIDDLRSTYPELIVIGIEPALKVAADSFPEGRVGIMATDVTLREEKLNRLIGLFPACDVEKIHAPGLVELVEAGKGNSPEADALLRPVLSPYAGKIDALVLGCTHYPFAAKSIRRILGPKIMLADGGEGTARETKRRLAEAKLLRKGTGGVIWKNSLDDPRMIRLSQNLLSQDW